jgi:hypothetical protein
MADQKISQFTEVTSLLSGDYLPLARSGANKRVSYASLLAGLNLGTMAQHAYESATVTGALGYTPLRPSNNLSDVASAAAARASLGLGTMAQQVAAGVNITGGSISGVTFGSGLSVSGAMNVSGTLNATNLAGNGSAITGIVAAGTGGTSSTGALSLVSDSDNSGGADRRIDFIHGVGGSALTALTLLEKFLGFGTTSPSAYLDINPPATGAHQIMRLRTNEAGDGDFGMMYYTTPNAFADIYGVLEGPPRRKLKDMVIGYNVGTGPNHNPGESEFVMAWEMNYVTSEGRPQNEWWVGCGAPGHGFTRPLSVDYYLDNGKTQLGFSSDRMIFSNQDGDDVWLTLSYFNEDSRADVTFFNNAGILFDVTNTREWMVSRQGIGMLGWSDAKVRLGESGGGDETAVLFTGCSTDTSSITLEFGGNEAGEETKAIRWNASPGTGSTGHFEFQEPFGAFIEFPDRLRNSGIFDVQTVDADTVLKFKTRTSLRSGADGYLQLLNAAGTGFSRVVFGTADGSGFALRFSGGVIGAITGNAGDWAPFDAKEYRASGTKVIGGQGAAVADATDAGSAITQLNALLARVRAHGLIAT